MAWWQGPGAAAGTACGPIARRPGQAALTQRVRIIDLCGGQLAGGRHLQTVVMDRLQQQAFLGPFECDGRSQIAAAQHRRATVDAEIAFDLRLAAVALETPRLEDRLNPGFEDYRLGRGRARPVSFSPDRAVTSQQRPTAAASSVPARAKTCLGRRCSIRSLPEATVRRTTRVNRQ